MGVEVVMCTSLQTEDSTEWPLTLSILMVEMERMAEVSTTFIEILLFYWQTKSQ
jgi:hypothetical protein